MNLICSLRSSMIQVVWYSATRYTITAGFNNWSFSLQNGPGDADRPGISRGLLSPR